MSSLNKFSVFVNEQIGVQSRLAKKYGKDEQRKLLHEQSRDRFTELLCAIVEADELLDSLQEQKDVQTFALTLQPDELEGLPKELLDELSEGAVPDKADAALLQVIRDRGGVASLDQIIVGIYKKTGELVKRNTLTSKLYRMSQKGTIFPVPEKKGVYSTRRISEEDAKRLFGEPPEQQSLV